MVTRTLRITKVKVNRLIVDEVVHILYFDRLERKDEVVHTGYIF